MLLHLLHTRLGVLLLLRYVSLYCVDGRGGSSTVAVCEMCDSSLLSGIGTGRHVENRVRIRLMG